jgi:hypothetical protein
VSILLSGAEGDDASYRVVGGNPDGDPVSRHYLDAKAAHPATQLGKDLMALVALHAVKPPAVDRHDGALNVNQVVLAQLYFSFHQSNIVPHFTEPPQTRLR